jgi:hypothetical protein
VSSSTIQKRAASPKTAGGAKLPVVPLDNEEYVRAWNTRAPITREESRLELQPELRPGLRLVYAKTEREIIEGRGSDAEVTSYENGVATMSNGDQVKRPAEIWQENIAGTSANQTYIYAASVVAIKDRQSALNAWEKLRKEEKLPPFVTPQSVEEAARLLGYISHQGG